MKKQFRIPSGYQLIEVDFEAQTVTPVKVDPPKKEYEKFNFKDGAIVVQERSHGNGSIMVVQTLTDEILEQWKNYPSTKRLTPEKYFVTDKCYDIKSKHICSELIAVHKSKGGKFRLASAEEAQTLWDNYIENRKN